MTQISHSDASGHNVNISGAARYFNYECAVALLSKVTDLRKRLFIDTLLNTGGRLIEILPLSRGGFVLDDPLSAAPLVSPFVVLRTLTTDADESGRLLMRLWSVAGDSYCLNDRRSFSGTSQISPPAREQAT